MTTELYDYQKAGVKRMHQLKGRVLLADSMGLGKTIQIIKYAVEADAFPMIVVCPRALKLQWQSELKSHFELDSVVLHGTTPRITKSLLEASIFIINWDILEMWLSFLRRRRPALVVGDEVQNISNLSAQRTQYFHSLCEGVKKVVLASGTPLTNCPWELFSSLSLLLPKVFDSSWSYGMEYCDGDKPYGKWQFKGAKNLPKLHAQLKETCLPYDTLVQTSIGTLSIGSIVERKLFVKVLCYDFATSSLQWRSIVAHHKRTTPCRMVRIQHQNGEFSCTSDHLIFTERGWTRAEKVTVSEMLRMVSQSNDVGHKGVLSEVLLTPLLRCSQREARRVQEEDGKNAMAERDAATKQSVSLLWSNQRTQAGDSNSLLLCHLCGESQSRNHNQGLSLRNKNREMPLVWQKNHPQGKSWFREKTNCSLQYEVCRIAQMVQNQSEDKDNKTVEGVETTEEIAHGVKMAEKMPRGSCTDTKSERPVSEGHFLLFDDRFDTSSLAIGHRSGRADAQHTEAESERSLEREGVIPVRVDSVEILQQGDRPWAAQSGQSNQVYDIEVEGCHNFFANGVLVHNCMIRRLKSEVAKDLPPKQRYVVPLDIDNRKEYDKAESDFIGWLREKDTAAAQRAAKAERFTKFTYLKHLAAQLKVNMVIAWLRGFLQESEGKIVMGTWHKDVLAKLLKEEWGTGVQAIDGDSTERNAKRSEVIFRTDRSTRILFGQIKTIGVGLNLPETSAVALAEIPFTPAACLQLEDRGSRITSVNPLDVYYLAASGTIEELLCKIIQRKARVSDAVLDGKQTFDDSLNVYDELQLALIQKGVL